MKQQSYKIKHDFLFDSEDLDVTIPALDDKQSNISELKLSDVLAVKDEISFDRLLTKQKTNIVIVDDTGHCNNPASIRYKEFIIRCVYRKLFSRNYNVYR